MKNIYKIIFILDLIAISEVQSYLSRAEFHIGMCPNGVYALMSSKYSRKVWFFIIILFIFVAMLFPKKNASRNIFGHSIMVTRYSTNVPGPCNWLSDHEIVIFATDNSACTYDINSHIKTNFSELHGSQLDRIFDTSNLNAAVVQREQWNKAPSRVRNRVISNVKASFGPFIEAKYCGKSSSNQHIAWLIKYDDSPFILKISRELFPVFGSAIRFKEALIITDNSGHVYRNLGVFVSQKRISKNLFGEHDYEIRWSPDGKHLSFVYSDSVWVTSAD